jgi:hypothetical protein
MGGVAVRTARATYDRMESLRFFADRSESWIFGAPVSLPTSRGRAARTRREDEEERVRAA